MDPTSLKFDIILDDNAFRTKIAADIALARDLNDTVSRSLNMKNLTQAATQTAAATKKVTTATVENTKAQMNSKAAIEASARSLSTGGGSLTRAWLRFSATVWSVISIVRLFVRAIGSAVKNIANFQQANANLATIMQVSRSEIEVLTNDALMLGRTTEWTASQVTELQTALAKLGYNIPQIRNMQASVLQFATAVGAKLPDAANLAGASLRMFGMRSSEMQRALEILTASTNKTALDFEKLKVSLPYVGAIAHSIGMDIAQTASLLGVLTNAGLESSRAGTGLRQVLLELSKQNGKLQTAMGGNIKTFDDFVNGLQAMRDRGLQAGEATKLVSTRASSALLILANGVDDIRRLNDEVRDTDGLLKTIQADRLDTLHGSTLLLKSAWEGLIQTFRDSAGPMKDIVDWLTKIVRATSLAAGRANRVAQGTKDVMGSDEITKRFNQRFDELLDRGVTPEEAAETVKKEMQKWLDGAYGDLATQLKAGYKETGFNRFLYGNPITHWLVARKMDKGRAANEQVEAVENSIDAVNDYMVNRAEEEGEIAAQAYLEQWKATFDAEGAEAARAAMSRVAGYENIKTQVEAYIANGGASGANDRGKGKGQSEETKQRAIISNLKEEANFLRKLLDDYKKLEPYLGEEGANAKMVSIFGEGDYSKESIERGILEITAALRDMGAEGKEAAQDIEQSMGLDAVSQAVKQLERSKKEAEKAQKAVEKYQKTLREWMSEDFNLSGTGFEFDVNKVFSDFNTKVGAVQERYVKAVEEAKEAHKGDAKAIEEETEKLMALRDAEIAYERVKSQESLNKLAESYLKDQYFLRGINMDNLSRLSLGQLINLKKELRSIGDEAVKMRTDFSGIEGFLASLGMDLETLTDEQLESLNDKLPESVIEMVRFAKSVKDTGLSFDGLIAKIKEAIKNGLEKLTEEEKKTIAHAAKYAATEVLELAKAFGELGDAMEDSHMSEAANSMQELGSFASDVAKGYSQGGVYGAIFGGVISIGTTILGGMAEQAKKEAELAKNMKEAAREYQDAIDEMTVSRYDTIFGTDKFGQLKAYVALFNKYKGVIEDFHNSMIEFMGISYTKDVLGPDGLLDLDKLKTELEYNYSGDAADEALRAIEKYKEALKEIDSIVDSIFGSIAQSAADKIVDSWIEAGNAALDYADILDDVAKAYSKMLIQSMIMETALDPITEDLKKAFADGRYGDAMELVAGAMQAIQEQAPMYEKVLDVFDPYFNRDGSDSSGSLGSGIKSITEDTASLLASYINAIRADVSYMRGMQEKGWKVIDAFGLSLPTLNDHVAQIAATNFDISQNTQSILSELRSVIGSPGTSGMVVRVENY